MSEEGKTPKGSGNTVAVVSVIATAIVALSCIIACAAIVIAFIINAPW